MSGKRGLLHLESYDELVINKNLADGGYFSIQFSNKHIPLIRIFQRNSNSGAGVLPKNANY